MHAVAETRAVVLDARARQSGGTSDRAIYEAVARILEKKLPQGNLLIDVGCGAGGLWPFVRERFTRYIGVDAVRYEGLAADLEFRQINLDQDKIQISNILADVTVSVETVEHLENPRAFMRELVRITRPGGFVIVTTPNQLSLLSLLTLIFKRRFSAFQDVHYPAHLTALLEIDLRRIAAECGLVDIEIRYTQKGRVVLTPWHYPAALSRLAPRLCSDNLLIVGRRAPDLNTARWID
jgi:2-polyprenyl-3-methyl-5-hydroxy-6-metoxy-1,4-benzoquinol methylase